AGTMYGYTVQSLNEDGAAGPSSTSFSGLTLADPPTVTTTTGDSTVTLTVTPPASEVVSQFNVYRWTGTARGALVGNTTGAGGIVTDTAVTNGTSYQYIATALNTSGEGPESSPIGPATPSASVLPPPATLSAASGTNAVTLTWPHVPGAASY